MRATEPELPAASVLASRLLTVYVALPLMSSVVLSAMASASTVIVSPVPLAMIVVLAVPVLMLTALSAASPVLTSSDPERLDPVRLPIRLLTTCLAAPNRVSNVF